MTAYDTDGKQVDRREIAIRPSASTSVRIADINDGDVAAIRLKDPAQAVVWNLRVGQKDVSGAQPFVRVDATCCLSDQKWSDGSCLRCGYRRFQYVVLIYEIRIGWVESH